MVVHQGFLVAAMILAPTLCSADFLPLRQGNTWTYREGKTGQTFTVRVGTPVVSNDKVYYSLHGYVETKVLARIDESGQLVYADEEAGLERVLTPFVPQEQGSWEAPFRQCESLSQALDKRGVHDGVAGPFENVLEVRYRTVSCADAGVEAEQYAENIGMVRRVVNSIAGPRKFDLVHAQVGRSTIDTASHGRFSVSADLTSGLPRIPVTLRLFTDPAIGLNLPFATAQEFDVLLLDSTGKVAWRWSDGQAFTQAAHSLTVNGNWSTEVELPREALLAGPSGAPDFTLQAWLTTTGDAPRFAASVPISVVAPASQSASLPRRARLR
jgi:hypothetical protein